MSDRKHASFDCLRPHDVVSVNFKEELLYFFTPKGPLKFKAHNTPETAFKHYFFGQTNKQVKDFLREKAEKVGIRAFVFDDTDGVLDVSFRKKRL